MRPDVAAESGLGRLEDLRYTAGRRRDINRAEYAVDPGLPPKLLYDAESCPPGKV